MKELYRRFAKDYAIYVAWTIALLSMLISLMLSEVFHFPPCILCWYQRIAMYPLSVIIGVAILYRDKFVHRYVLPLTLTGLAVSVYHNLLYWKIIPEADAPCRAGVSCTTKFFEWFGFVTIPFLSLCAFTAITVLVIISWKGQTNE